MVALNRSCLSTDSTPTSSLPVEQIEIIRSGQEEFRRNLANITRQSSIFFAGASFTLVVGYLFRIYLARELGARLLGWNALGMGLYSLCKLIGQMGLPPAAVRYVAVYSSTERPERLRSFFWRAVLWTFAGTATLGTAVVLGRHWIAAGFFNDPQLAPYLPLFAVLIPVGAVSAFLNQTLTGLKMVSRSTLITNFISFPFMMVSTVVALSVGLSLWGYVAAQVVAELLTLTLAAVSVWRANPAHPRFRDIPGEDLSPEVWWFALSMLGLAVLEFMSGQADRLIVGHYLEAKQVGIYAIASAAAGLNAMVLQAVNSIFAPTIANLHAQGEHVLLLRLFQTLTKWIIAFTLPLALLFILLAPTLMGIFGPDFQAGSLVLCIITLGQLVNSGTGSVGYLLLMSGNQKRLIRIQVVMATAILLANVILIPRLGITGAALVAASGMALANLAYLVIVRRTLGLFPYNRSYLKLVGPALAATGGVWLLRIWLGGSWRAIPLLLLAFVVGYTVFLAGFVAFGLNDDDRMIVDMVRSRVRALFAG